MDMEVVGLTIASIITAVFGVMLFVSKPKLPALVFLALTTLSASVWSFGIAIFLSSDNELVLRVAAQAYYIAALCVAVSSLSVALTMGHARKRHTIIVWSWASCAILASIISAAPSLLVEQIYIEPYHGVVLQTTGYAVYSAYFAIVFFVALGVLAARGVLERKKIFRSQFKLLFAAYSLAGVVGVFFNLLLPGIGIYHLIWIGPLGVLLFIPIAYVAISRHGLFDLKEAASRTIAYALSLAVLGAVYYGVAHVVSLTVGGINGFNELKPGLFSMTIALALAFLFQPVRIFFDRWTDRLFYRDEQGVDELLAALSSILTNTLEKDLLMKRITRFLVVHLKIDRAIIAMKEETGELSMVAVGGNRLVKTDMHELIEQLCDNGVLSAEEIEDELLRNVLKAAHVSFVVPLVIQGQTLGCIFMGHKRIGDYSMRDINLMRLIGGEVAVAIKNAQSMEEVRKLNDELQQRIEDATKELRASNRQLQKLDEAKNEFISMASHQLRTPLTSIKGYLDMLLQGDMGKLAPTQRAVLREAFSSSERMVQLINDFLNVSRLQTGKFTINRQLVNLGDIIKEEVTLLRVVAEQRGIRLVTKIDRSVVVNIDADKVRQVVMNMIDNAIYYSKPKMTVTVTLKKTGEDVEFVVKDHGIGVPEAEQSGLFSKFFRGSNARKRRPDGTGVGLFLAKKVVLEHDGEMIFSSVENKGSVFGFRLPLRQPKEGSS